MSDLKAIQRRFVEEYQGLGNVDTAEELLADDFVDHAPMPGVPGTRDRVMMLFAGLRAGLPDMSVEIHDMLQDGDRVVTRKTSTARTPASCSAFRRRTGSWSGLVRRVLASQDDRIRRSGPPRTLVDAGPARHGEGRRRQVAVVPGPRALGVITRERPACGRGRRRS